MIILWRLAPTIGYFQSGRYIKSKKAIDFLETKNKDMQ
jgi:hypothetical protein